MFLHAEVLLDGLGVGASLRSISTESPWLETLSDIWNAPYSPGHPFWHSNFACTCFLCGVNQIKFAATQNFTVSQWIFDWLNVFNMSKICPSFESLCARQFLDGFINSGGLLCASKARSMASAGHERSLSPWATNTCEGHSQSSRFLFWPKSVFASKAIELCLGQPKQRQITSCKRIQIRKVTSHSWNRSLQSAWKRKLVVGFVFGSQIFTTNFTCWKGNVHVQQTCLSQNKHFLKGKRKKRQN